MERPARARGAARSERPAHRDTSRWRAAPLLPVLLLLAAPLFAAHTERVSTDSFGRQGNTGGFAGALSADGRFVAFASTSSNIVRKDKNRTRDIFVLDRLTGTVERVSVSTSGEEGNDMSDFPSISADGRFVVFSSYASNLVPGDTNGGEDVFLHDRQSGTTERVSVDSAGGEAGPGSGNAFDSISSDGRLVVFTSLASNLVPGDTNGKDDVFVRDRQLGVTERVSVATGGGQGSGQSAGSAITPDGRYVVFDSDAPDLVANDANGATDVFIHDRQTGVTERVSVAFGGGEADGGSAAPSVSADGRYVVFASSASNLVPGDTNGVTDVFVRDRQLGVTERVSVSSAGAEGNARSFGSAISADGRYVAFGSDASNLVPGDTNGMTDVFVRDRQEGKTYRVSIGSNGEEGNGRTSFGVAISADGLVVSFDSTSTNLVPGDVLGIGDSLVRVGDDDGDGLPEWGGDCNDANAAVVGGCTCTSDAECDDTDPCTADACVGGSCESTPLALTPRKTRLSLRKPDSLRRYSKLNFSAEVTLPYPFDPPLDPATNGVILDMVNGRGQRVKVEVPGGPLWTVNRAGTRWKYSDPAGSVAGVKRVVVSARSRRDPGRVRVVVKADGGSFVRGAPLVVRWLPGASGTQCGEATFLQPDAPKPHCRERSLTGGVRCRQKAPTS